MASLLHWAVAQTLQWHLTHYPLHWNQISGALTPYLLRLSPFVRKVESHWHEYYENIYNGLCCLPSPSGSAPASLMAPHPYPLQEAKSYEILPFNWGYVLCSGEGDLSGMPVKGRMSDCLCNFLVWGAGARPLSEHLPTYPLQWSQISWDLSLFLQD